MTRDHHRQAACQQGIPAAVNHAAEDIPAKVVRTEEMLRRRRLQTQGQILGNGIIGRNNRRQNRQQDPGQTDDNAQSK